MAAPEAVFRRAERNVSEVRKLISRWHRNKLGAERNAARRKCSKALAPILDIIRKNAAHASLKGGGRFTGMPLMALGTAKKLRPVCHLAAMMPGHAGESPVQKPFRRVA